jgi:NAD(P)-dependent dehydrogenase (short-subunit alcohol dehydrogenase family)
VLVVVRGHDTLSQGLRDIGVDVVTTFPPAFDALVHVPDLSAVVQTPVVELDEAAWDARGEALLRRALHDCRLAHAGMRERGGRIILITPTVALVGAAGLAPFAMAAEGMRTLAKAAARQWGVLGITANCVAPSLDVFGTRHDADGSVAAALGRTPTLDDLVTVVASLLGDAGALITGTTITLDGGVVMAP